MHFEMSEQMGQQKLRWGKRVRICVAGGFGEVWSAKG